MEIIVRPRQTGKTFEMVKWVLAGRETHSYPGWSRVILTPTLDQADYIRKQYPALEYHQVYSWREWRERFPGREFVEVAVDNADEVLAQAIGQRAAVASFTGGE
jgi:hypothetical protein